MKATEPSRASRFVGLTFALVAVFALVLALGAPHISVQASPAHGHTSALAPSDHDHGTPEGTEHPHETESPEGTEHPHETESPEATETEHPHETESPEATETEHPHETESPEPSESPEATETEHPHETESPEATETEHPHETEPPEATETEHPQPTKTEKPGAPPVVVSIPGSGSRLFPQTGRAVVGLFLGYWDGNGGLAQQGYPLSPMLREVSPLNGQPYTVQYFERAVFEYHPENQAPFNVLLSQLGTFQYRQKYPNGAPQQHVDKAGGQFFALTGHWVGGKFWTYWQQHGGLAQQGYPLSDEFTEVSPLNGKSYTVQYFERAVFEWHPENAGTPFEVLLSQLGTFRYQQMYSR